MENGKINKVNFLCKEYNISLDDFLRMKNDGIINHQTINRVITNLLFDEYREKYKTIVGASKRLAEDLGITEHTVQHFVYNNRNKGAYNCVECGAEITAHYHYQRDSKCVKCYNKQK